MSKTKKLPKNLRVYVSNKDKKGAQRGSSETCPLARCLKRNIQGKNIFVRNDGKVEIRSGYWGPLLATYRYSEFTKQKIKKFDQKKRAFPVGHVRLTRVD